MILEAKGPSSYQTKNKTLWRKTISVQDRHCWNKLPSNIKEINSVSFTRKSSNSVHVWLATYQTYPLFCMVLSVDKLSLLLLLLSLLLLLLLLSIIPQ